MSKVMLVVVVATFTVAAYNPAGRRVDPDSGPVSHESSSWTHDGERSQARLTPTQFDRLPVVHHSHPHR